MPEDALLRSSELEATASSAEVEDLGRSSPQVSKSRIDIGRRCILLSAWMGRSKEVPSSPPPGESTRYEPRRLQEGRQARLVNEVCETEPEILGD